MGERCAVTRGLWRGTVGELDTAVTAVTVAPGDASGAVMSKSFFNRKKSESSRAA